MIHIIWHHLGEAPLVHSTTWSTQTTGVDAALYTPGTRHLQVHDMDLLN